MLTLVKSLAVAGTLLAAPVDGQYRFPVGGATVTSVTASRLAAVRANPVAPMTTKPVATKPAAIAVNTDPELVRTPMAAINTEPIAVPVEKLVVAQPRATTPRMCCKALTAQCMACAAGVSVSEYCDKRRGVFPGCAPLVSQVPDPKDAAKDTTNTAPAADRAGGTSIAVPATTVPEEARLCCKALTAPCLACAAGVTVAEYCTSQTRRVRGCEDVKDAKDTADDAADRTESFVPFVPTVPIVPSVPSVPIIVFPPRPKNGTASPPPRRCVSDEDCLQTMPVSGGSGCATFCVDSQCLPWTEDYPPVLRLRSGLRATSVGFVLREGEELEKLFADAPVHYPEEVLAGRFLERVQGGPELLEIRYPDGFFAMAAAALETGAGEVPASDRTRTGMTVETMTTDQPVVAGTVDTVGTSGGAGVLSSDATVVPGRRLTAIQGDAPDRWHAGVNSAAHPWRMNGRLSSGCTAALIGNRVLITAAHCVYDKATNSWADFPTFAAGQDGDTKPFGEARVQRMTIPAGYVACNTNGVCRAHDWAVLVLRSADTMSVGYFGFSTTKGGHRLNLAGYPQSKDKELWYDHCPLLSDEGDWIKHRCDTEPGNSGSAIYTIRDGGRYVVAVHGGGYTDQWNRGADVAGRTSSAGRLFDRMLAYRRIYG